MFYINKYKVRVGSESSLENWEKMGGFNELHPRCRQYCDFFSLKKKSG